MSVSAMLLDPTTSLKYVQQHARDRWADAQRAEYEVCIALRRLFVANAHRGIGRSRFNDWAEQNLGIPAKLASIFSYLGSYLEARPLTRQALEAGRLTYTKAREFVKLATPETEQEWIDYATTHTNRDIERKVARIRDDTEEDMTTFKSRVTPQEMQALRNVREGLMKKLGQAVPNERILSTLATALVEGDLFGALSTGEGEEGEDPKPMPRATLRPYCSIQFCPHCLSTWVPAPGENLRVPFSHWMTAMKDGAEVVDLIDHFLCDCEGDRHRRDRCPNRRPTTGPVPKNRHIPAAVRKVIEARDGFRCRVPGCGNPVPLEMGHVKPYCEGTPTLPEFVGVQCATCNDLIEEGALRVEGEAPFEQYYLKDWTFLGYGFDPRPHVGTGSGGADEPESGPPEG
jgi:hypothetical protein